jgi:hypothetical protein
MWRSRIPIPVKAKWGSSPSVHPANRNSILDDLPHNTRCDRMKLKRFIDALDVRLERTYSIRGGLHPYAQDWARRPIFSIHQPEE